MDRLKQYRLLLVSLLLWLSTAIAGDSPLDRNTYGRNMQPQERTLGFQYQHYENQSDHIDQHYLRKLEKQQRRHQKDIERQYRAFEQNLNPEQRQHLRAWQRHRHRVQPDPSPKAKDPSSDSHAKNDTWPPLYVEQSKHDDDVVKINIGENANISSPQQD